MGREGGLERERGQLNDRAAFERIWAWTRANLMVRDDQLIAWRWEPGQRPAVSDMNNASDGDILIAWALAEAAELWADVAHRASGRRIAVEIGRKLALFKSPHGALLLPGVTSPLPPRVGRAACTL